MERLMTKTVNAVSADCPAVTCPDCSALIDCMSDPRGETVSCPDCQLQIEVAAEAEITLS